MLLHEKGAGKILAPFLFFVFSLIPAGSFSQNACEDPFPVFSVIRSGSPGPGCFVFAVSPYLVILDGEGDPVFFRRINGGVRNFSIRNGTFLTYYDNTAAKFFALDPYYHLTDSFAVSGDYTTDFHSLGILSDRHVLVTGTALRHVDMSVVVQGGNPGATVRDVILQELDGQGRVVFQWNSRDHFSITDADTDLVDLTASVIDYVHANSFVMTPDSNFLLTSRNMSEVTKINRQTGEIMWRLGGKNNQFTDTSEEVSIKAVHSAVLLNDTLLLLFDNGTAARDYSQGLEYHIDQGKKNLRKIRDYRHNPDIFTPVMGNTQYISASRRLIGWGKNSESLICTVYDTMSDPLMEIKTANQDPYWSYSVSFGVWEDSVLEAREDSLAFRPLTPGDSAVTDFAVVNTGKEEMIFTGFSMTEDVFFCMNLLPERTERGDSVIIHAGFRPDTAGEYRGVLLLFFTPASAAPEEERIIRKVKLYGSCRSGSGVYDRPGDLSVKIVPNPFRNNFMLYYQKEIKRIAITTISGRRVFHADHPRSGMVISLQDHPAGIYLLYLYREESHPVIRKIIKF